MKNAESIRVKIRELITDYNRLRENPFVPGVSKVRYAGSIYDEKELIAATDALLDGWFGLGKNAEILEREFAKYVGTKNSLLTNSGSSANLIAVSALASENADGRIEKGSEAITPATTFPTTLNPIIQNGLVPVFVDIRLGSYNIDIERIEGAITKKTKLLMLPHTLGNPNEMDRIMELAERYNLRVIEDSCDALGSTFKGRQVGSFGEFGTFSFYPSHHMTMGEGGAVVCNDPSLTRIAGSLRSWGRGCRCRGDEKTPDGACGARFEFMLDGIPYDHKFTYHEIGYSLKPTELQAAFGVEQLRKVPGFVERRKENFRKMHDFFLKYEDYFILPEATPNSKPSWFCFPLTVRDNAPFGRNELTRWLERNMIETRLIFAGNILRQPAYRNIKCRVVGRLDNSNKAMRDAFFLGVYPGLTDGMLDYVFSKVDEFMKNQNNQNKMESHAVEVIDKMEMIDSY